MLLADFKLLFSLCDRQTVGQQITVCVRKRPLSHAECKGGEVDVVTATDGQCVIVHESKESVDLTPYILQVDVHIEDADGSLYLKNFTLLWGFFLHAHMHCFIC